MMGSVFLLIGLMGPTALLAMFLYFRFPDATAGRMDRWVPPVTSAISAWALCTSWLWFYLFNLYLSLPALVLAIGLHIYAISKNLNPRLCRINTILIFTTLGMGLLSYFYFDV